MNATEVRVENPGYRLDELPDVLTPRQVAEILQCSPTLVYDMCRRGELPSMKVGRLVRIPKRPFITWMEEG